MEVEPIIFVCLLTEELLEFLFLFLLFTFRFISSFKRNEFFLLNWDLNPRQLHCPSLYQLSYSGTDKWSSKKCFIQMFWTHVMQKKISSRRPWTSIGRLAGYFLWGLLNIQPAWSGIYLKFKPTNPPKSKHYKNCPFLSFSSIFCLPVTIC